MVVEISGGGRWGRAVVVRGELVVVLRVQRLRLRLRTLPVRAGFAVDLLAVEIPVAVACGADDAFQHAVVSGGHELAAAVNGVAAEADGVVLLAFSVPHRRHAERALPRLAAADFRPRVKSLRR
ncbi:hypothetical protein P7M27_26295, partial [Vibrio parahaemolyticus]|nr:hypothetical protein [Vibrio parahaemolyticus]